MKRRVVSFVAVTCALLCWAVCVLLIIDHPFSARLGARTSVYYSGGRIVGEYRSRESLVGPAEVIGHRGDDPYYVNFAEIQAWRQSLPASTSEGGAGVYWFQRFAEREENGVRLAEKVHAIAINAEYLLALVAITGAVAVKGYLMIRRREKRIAAGLCAACGYDLRASGGRCPECGAPRARIVSLA